MSDTVPLTLRFYDPTNTQMFKAFCSRTGTTYNYERDDERGADVFAMSFENKTARSKFISSWSRASTQVVT